MIPETITQKESIQDRLNPIARLREAGIKSLVGSAVFFAMIVLLTGVYLFGSFRGMNDTQAMEHAYLGREVVRGNGLAAKVINPAVVHNLSQNQIDSTFTTQQDTYNAPGYAFVNAAALAMVDGTNTEKYKIKGNQNIYKLDRILAATALGFFLLSIVVSYGTAKLLFDKKIAQVTAILMLLSSSMWEFVQSCLPQMFMLLLFSLIINLSIKAFLKYESTAKTPWLNLILCALLFGVLALTKWTTLWIFLGYLGFVLIHFKPRGAVTTISALTVLALISPALIHNYNQFGSPLGASGLTIVNGLNQGFYGAEASEFTLRNYVDTPVDYRGVALNTLKNSFHQIDGLISHLGGIVAAPLFFLALIHLYKRHIHNVLKWGILIMWAPAVIGMAIFGTPETDAPSGDQLHILFAPIMTMFGLSIIALLWSRLTLSRHKTSINSLHFFVVVALSSGSLISALPSQIQHTFKNGLAGKPNAPYFLPAELTSTFKDRISEVTSDPQPVIFSDQPAAVAWYADTHAVALPVTAKQLNQLELKALSQKIKIAAIHTTPVSTSHFYKDPINMDLMPLVNSSLTSYLLGTNHDLSLKKLANNQNWANLAQTYPTVRSIISESRASGSKGLHVLHTRTNK